VDFFPSNAFMAFARSFKLASPKAVIPRTAQTNKTKNNKKQQTDNKSNHKPKQPQQKTKQNKQKTTITGMTGFQFIGGLMQEATPLCHLILVWPQQEKHQTEKAGPLETRLSKAET